MLNIIENDTFLCYTRFVADIWSAVFLSVCNGKDDLMMKRRLIFCLVALGLMLLCCAFASAETRGGHMPDVVLTPEDLLVPRAGTGITISGPRNLTTGISVAFSASGRDDIRMAVMGIGSMDPLTLYYEYIAYGKSMTFKFYEPGTYYIYAWDAHESSINSGWGFRVTVTGNSLLSQKITTIISQCNAAAGTPYEKALWIHDYLIYNACFDPGMNQYGAGGVLMEGLGVCDSYSRAYELLMNAMGIDCMRQSGGNHSWNVVRMDDGQWYWVDCTWDDPADRNGGTAAVSGNETHRNFGLSDDLLSFMGHTWSNAVASCTHLEYNYYVMSGETDPWHAAVTESVMSHVSQGETSFSVTLNGRYELPQGHYDLVKLGWTGFYYTISAYLLDGMQIEANGMTYTLRAVYDPADSLTMSFFLQVPPQITASYGYGQLIITVRGISTPCTLLLDDVFDLGMTVSGEGTYKKTLDLAEGEHTLTMVSENYNINVSTTFTAGAGLGSVLTVPVGVETIEEEAFCGMTMEMVVITSNCTYIGSRAFADCPNLVLVEVSQGCEIEPDAFEGCPDELEIIYWEE